jgi:beta-xylosidase
VLSKGVVINNDKTPLQRADDLLRKMTFEEKVLQLTGVMPSSVLGPSGLDEALMDRFLSRGIGHIDMFGTMLMRPPRELARSVNSIQRFLVEKTRLGVPAMFHGEAISGFIAPGFSAFPTPIAQAAAWRPALVQEMGDIIRKQMRAAGFQQALSPVLDVARDARWGRVHETYGEDPYVISAMGVAFTRGIQGANLREGVIATAKHFLGYGLTEAGQNMAVAHLGKRELYDVFATPFEAAIKLAGLRGIMNSYSEVDGVPVVGSPEILRTLLRERMGFEGIVVSDYAAVDWLFTRQAAAESLHHAGLLALQAGLDVELPSLAGFGVHFDDDIREGRLDEALLDDAVRRMLRDKFELGIFDHPYVREDAGEIPMLAEGKKLSSQLAADSLTLLKNSRGVLPLSASVQRLGVLGPHAIAAMANFSAYTYPAYREQTLGMATGQTKIAGIETFSANQPEGARDAMKAKIATLLEQTTEDYVREQYGAVGLSDALRLAAPSLHVTALEGSGVVNSELTDIPSAVAVAEEVDLVVLAVGGRSGWFGTTVTEGEASDSSSIELPECQMELARAVAATGTPVVAVVFMGRPYAIAELDDLADAVIVAFYPGPEGARVIADTLIGTLNPGGKLPYTLPRITGQVPIYHYQKRGSGYRRNPKSDLFTAYVDGPMTPLYPFGHGLSYTSFSYSDLQLSARHVDTLGEITVSVYVSNSGDRAGDEVVQLYFGASASGLTRPAQQLVGFHRLHLERGATSVIEFQVAMSQLGFTDREGQFGLNPGPIDVAIGSSSDDLRLKDQFEVIGAAVSLEGRRSYLSVATIHESATGAISS